MHARPGLCLLSLARRRRSPPGGSVTTAHAVGASALGETLGIGNKVGQFFHEPVNSFAAWREELRRVYDNDLERVDLMTGLYAEPLPQGFGFSETAFRIFGLMASRRLKGDRFFTDDYRPEIYYAVRP